VDAPLDMISRVLGRAAGVAGWGREYLAGFGTSGSLLAVAALLFVVASAMVAFRGWPHVAAQPSPGEVVVSPRPTAATGSLVGRRLAAIAGAPAGAAAAPAAGTGVAALRPGGALTAPHGTQRSIGQPASTARPVAVAGGTPTQSAGGAAPACCGSAPSSGSGSGSGSGPLKPVRQVVSQAAGALGGVVSGTGNQVGSTVQQTTGAVGAAVQPVSPAAAGAVNSVGSGAAQTVTGVTQTIAGALSGVGQP
jgi:hypothetical protein